MNGGRLSPLRSPRQFDNEVKQIETHQPINDYAAHGYPPNNFSKTPSSYGRRNFANGHTKCYYEELSSVVRSRLGDLMLTVAEEEQRIERQRQSLG